MVTRVLSVGMGIQGRATLVWCLQVENRVVAFVAAAAL